MNGGASYDFDREKYADPEVLVPVSLYPVRREYAEVSQRAPADGAPWYAGEATIFYSTLLVTVQPSRHVKRLILSLDCDTDYELALNEGESQASIEASCPGLRGGGFAAHTIALAEPMLVWRVSLEAVGGDGWYSLGHLQLEGDE